jgi:ATP-dependent exoDNAse (exonuclease V) beta subunit
LRFGELFHSILRDTDLFAGRESIARLAAIHGKVTGASCEEVESAVEAVAAALAHPILRQAAASPRCHREMPLLLPIAGGRTLEGVIDLAFLTNNQWTVVDFKTDGEFLANNSRYERQVQWYVYGLATLTGLPARGVLLRA